MGTPRASMTRPRKPSPTGIPAVLWVRRTMSPAATSPLSPNSTQERSSFLRSCIMPFTPEGKVSISPYRAWASPLMVATSLSTASTSPISSGSALGRQLSTASCIRGSMSFSPSRTFSRWSRNCRKVPWGVQSYTSEPTCILKPTGTSGSISQDTGTSRL